ncbi:uncharacterized protein [Anoplolepis gracilipes]|uniref:uncharacterized protein n=1 Tax=Anoplolepis gracilipes TaxID=354296 RepID=UPI003B9E7D66
MKLLLLLSLIMLASAALVAEEAVENDDVSSQANAGLQVQPSVQDVLGERKLGKRSLLSVGYVDAYTPLLPWYRLGGLSSYKLYDHGWYPNLSLRTGGWYRGW